MRRGTTESGFVYELDELRLDDMRVVDVLAVVTDESEAEFERLRSASKLVELLLGRELKAQLYDHIGKTYGGRVPYAALEAELGQIMGSAGKDAGKN